MKQLELSITINTSAQKVWDTLINPSIWWNDVTLDLKVGGLLEERWGDTVTQGAITVLEPPKRLELSWRDEDWPATTSVCFILTAEKNTTHVTLEHSGWNIFPKETALQLISDHKMGWKSHLLDLKRAAER